MLHCIYQDRTLRLPLSIDALKLPSWVFRKEYAAAALAGSDVRLDLVVLIYLYAYHPRYKRGRMNPNFDQNSQAILNLKQGDPYQVKVFRTILDLLFPPNIAVAVVPSHTPTSFRSGVRIVAQQLAAVNRIDATSCLERTRPIDKLSQGGDRSMKVHFDSISVVNKGLIQAQNVLLLDDVATTGNSLEACRQLLLNAGAARVQKFALSQTVGWSRQ